MSEELRVKMLMRLPNSVFVFGANEAGIHGKGAAKDAVEHYGAVYGQPFGLQGRSFAIPTKDENLKSLPLMWIKWYVSKFLEYARTSPGLTFVVTRIGCGLAGYKDKDIAPLFAGAPKNVMLPRGWDDVVS
jgi:hypothetical protein